MKKTIHYRQVLWFGQQENLPALIHEALIARPNVSDTLFQSDGETFEVCHRTGDQNEMRLHLVTHIQGARKAIVPHAQPIAAAEVAEAAAPADTEFTEREIAIVIRNDKIGYVSSGLTLPKRVERAIRGLLALGHTQELANRLMLAARADAAIITELMQQGVDQLDFGLVLPSAEAHEVVEAQPLSIGQTIGRLIQNEISTRITNDFDDAEIGALEETKASLRLKLRKRKPTIEQVRSLTAVASQAVEGDEEFRIRTLEGAEFTRETLILKATFEHPSDTATLRYLLAWTETSAFLNLH